MNQNDERHILYSAVEHFGVRHQMERLIEESAELIVAIEHSKRNRIPVEKLIEEMADVEIVLDQMKLCYSQDIWSRIRSEKLERLYQTIENDKRPSQCSPMSIKDNKLTPVIPYPRY